MLKSEFNTAWNYFSALELGDTVLGYWHGWLAATELNNFSVWYPAFSGDLGDLESIVVVHCIIVNASMGPSPIPDVQTISLADRKLKVSHKRTRNLFDLTSLWKKMVIDCLERDVLEPEEHLIEALDNSLSNESKTNPSYLFCVINYW